MSFFGDIFGPGTSEAVFGTRDCRHCGMAIPVGALHSCGVLPMPANPRTAQLEAQLAEAKALLTKHQWSGPDERCPECSGHEWRQGYHAKEQGHAPDCRLAKVIRE